MITVNGKPIEWVDKMNIFILLKTMGYTLKKPSVLIKVNNEVIKKSGWDDFFVKDRDEITVVNLLRGG